LLSAAAKAADPLSGRGNPGKVDNALNPVVTVTTPTPKGTPKGTPKATPKATPKPRADKRDSSSGPGWRANALRARKLQQGDKLTLESTQYLELFQGDDTVSAAKIPVGVALASRLDWGTDSWVHFGVAGSTELDDEGRKLQSDFSPLIKKSRKPLTS